MLSLLEKAMAPHSSTLAWKIPWTEEPGGLQSMQSWRVRHDFTFTFHFHALEKEMATHSSVPAWRIPGTAEPGGLPSMGSQRVRHDWSDLAATAAAAGIQSTLMRDSHFINNENSGALGILNENQKWTFPWLSLKKWVHIDNLSYIREETRTALTRKARTWHKRKRENVVMSTLRRKKNINKNSHRANYFGLWRWKRQLN